MYAMAMFVEQCNLGMCKSLYVLILDSLYILHVITVKWYVVATACRYKVSEYLEVG